jgi:hypothetical protein
MVVTIDKDRVKNPQQEGWLPPANSFGTRPDQITSWLCWHNEHEKCPLVLDGGCNALPDGFECECECHHGAQRTS